jgi:outer membrane protein OmpA-like peptidoglycan-associated protein
LNAAVSPENTAQSLLDRGLIRHPKKTLSEGSAMPTGHNLTAKAKTQLSPRQALHLVRDKFPYFENGRSWDRVRVRAWIAGAVVLLFTANGCVATRSWVNDQLEPIKGQLGQQEARLNNLRLEHRLVLDSNHGPTFAFDSAALTANGKREIDGFIEDLEGSTDAKSAPGRLFVVAGHTDSVGPEDYNYGLGQRRAESVAGYLIGREGLDPMQVRVVSYGASRPLADNSTSRGRRTNRRVEILVYQEKISAGS